MKFSKLLIPFLAVLLPTVHFAHNETTDTQTDFHNKEKSDGELSVDESGSHEIILQAFDNSERFLNFAKHSSHSSHRSHSSHSSHKSGNHSSHYSGSGRSDCNCNGCEFDVDEDQCQEKSEEVLVAKK